MTFAAHYAVSKNPSLSTFDVVQVYNDGDATAWDVQVVATTFDNTRAKSLRDLLNGSIGYTPES